MGNFNIKIIIKNNLNKIISQKNLFIRKVIKIKISKILKINSGETLNLGRN